VSMELAENVLLERPSNLFETAVEGLYQSTADGRVLAVNTALATILGYDSHEDLIDSVTEMEEQYYVDPATRTMFKRLLDGRDVVYGLEYQAYRKDRSKIWVLENARAVRDEAGALLYYEGSIEEIAERKRAEAEREVIFEIVQGVSTTANLDELLRLIHGALKRIVYAENCVVALYDPETGYFHQPFYVDQFDTASPPWKMEKSCTAYVLRTGRPLLMSLELYNRLIEQGEVEAIGTPAPSWLGVPLKTPTGTIGVLLMQHYEEENAYSQRDVEFVTSVAGQIALAIERKGSEEALRKAHDELESRVEERTIELSRANLSLTEQIAERLRAEEAVLESEHRYRAFVENSSEGIWRMEVERPISIALPIKEQISEFYIHAYLAECNDVMAQMYGFARAEDIVGARLSELLPKSKPANTAYLEDFVSSDYRLIDAESSDTDKTGLARYFLNNLVGLVKDGVIYRAWGTQRNITERKRMEAECNVLSEIMQGVSTLANLDELLGLVHRSLGKILSAENCFVSLYDNVTGLFHKRFYVDQYNPNSSPQMMSKSCSAHVFRTSRPLRMTEATLDEMLERGDSELIGERAAAWLGVPLQTATETIGVLVVQNYSDPDAYSDRDLEYLSSVGSQVALAIDRKRTEEALQEANKRAITEYEQLVERISQLGQTLGTARDLLTVFRTLRDFAVISAPCDAIVISLYDAQTKDRTTSYAWTDGQEIEITDALPVNPGSGRVSKAIETQQVVITHDYIKYTESLRKIFIDPAENNMIPDSALVAPMSVMGKPIGVLEIQSYQPHAYTKEHSVAIQMAANLAAITIENVRLLEVEREKEEQLRQSQKMEAVGKLAGGVAHDFNNLLTAITGYSDLSLRRLEEGHPLRRNLLEIKKAGERAATLTRQLLAFSRKQMLQPKVLDLNSVVADMFKMLQRLIGEDIDLLSSVDYTLGQIKADPGQLQQVLMNLCVNARDAMPHGGKLTIKTSNIYVDKEYSQRHVSIQPGDYVLLSVSDTGSGMDAETQARIFEPFFTTKEQGKGTGLGLSTVYGIVKQSGGNIWVYSEVGGGTTFKIYLPRFDKVIEAEPERVTSEADSAGTETILLVEDEEVVRNLTSEALRESGYNILEAKDTQHAIALCREFEGEIHLMLSDVVMPVMSGRVLAEVVAPIRPNMRVLYMSGYTDDHIVHHGVLEEGMNFLEKPFTAELLARKVRSVLDKANLTVRSDPES
jgi:PAS domain S-box-containing protein